MNLCGRQLPSLVTAQAYQSDANVNGVWYSSDLSRSAKNFLKHQAVHVMEEIYIPVASLLKDTSPAIAFLLPLLPLMALQSKLVKFADIAPWDDFFPYAKGKA